MIFPVTRMSRIEVVNHLQVYSYSRVGEREHKMLLDFIGKERQKQGMFGETEYIKAISANKASIKRGREKSVAVVNPKEIIDVVYYHRIDNVDECLDAINDMNTLHEMFGDEAYLQLKDLLSKRIKELQK